MDSTLEPRACEELVAPLENGDEPSSIVELRGAEGSATTTTQADDEPQILDLGEETEPESDGEVELVLVNGDLVQLQSPRSVGDGAQVVDTEPMRELEQLNAEQHQEDEKQEQNALDANTSERTQRAALAHMQQTPASTKGAQFVFVELPGDEILLRALVARVPQFANPATPNRLVWHDVAMACGGRFASGISAQLRVRWLQGVSLDPSHHMHSHLTEELRTLITQYRDARAGHTVQPPASLSQKRPLEDGSLEPPETACEEPTKRLCLSQPQQPPQDADRDGVHNAHDSTESARTSLSPATRRVLLDMALEEKTMLIVLKHAPRFATVERKMEVWDAIATDSHGRYKTAMSARIRTMWFCRVVQDPSHHEHANITPRLREMVHQFLALYSQDERCVPFSTRDDTDASPSASPRSTQQAKKRTNNPWKMVHAPMDELLIQLVLEKRPFAAGSKERTVRWVEIAQTLQSPYIQNGTGGQARVRWLVNVMQNDAHSEHDRITPKLRSLLTEFLQATSSLETDSPKNNVGSRRVRHGGEGESKKEESDDNSGEEEEKDQEDEDDNDEEEDDDEEENSGATIAMAPTTSENEVLLREILRVRPFHVERGGGTALWRRVTATVQRTLGSKTAFPTSTFCVYHMRRLLRVVRNPKLPARASGATIPRHQLEMLTLIDTLITTKWPLVDSHLTKRHRALLDDVAKSLKKPRVVASEEDDRTLADDGGDAESDESSDDGLEDQLQEEKRCPGRGGGGGGGVGEEQRPNEMSPLRVRVDHRRSITQRSVVTPPPRKATPTERRHTGSDDDTVETELDDLRASLDIQVKSLQSEIATCRAQLTLQNSTVEHERQEHRAELRAMMELLATERETHKSETEAMLAMLQREQKDRKDEFVAMMNLVTRSMACAAPEASLSPDEPT